MGQYACVPLISEPGYEEAPALLDGDIGLDVHVTLNETSEYQRMSCSVYPQPDASARSLSASSEAGAYAAAAYCSNVSESILFHRRTVRGNDRIIVAHAPDVSYAITLYACFYPPPG